MTAATPHDLDRLIDDHLDAIYGYVAFRMAPNREAAADLVQDILEAAIRGWRGVRDVQTARAWLMQIARNKVADFFRSASASIRTLPLDAALAMLDREPDEATRARSEQATLVSLALRHLSDDQVELLEQKYLCDLPVRTIARNRGMTEKAIESALSRARDAFREAYQRLSNTQESAR